MTQRESLMYPRVQADKTGCVHAPVMVMGVWSCRHCALTLKPVLMAASAMELRAVIEPEPVDAPMCDECGARHCDSDALWQMRSCVVDLEDGVAPKAVARRMRQWLGM